MTNSPNPKRGRPHGSRSFTWRAFFQESTTPVFVLSKGRRLRFANAAWEKLTGTTLADSLGMVCSARRHSSALATVLAPPPEVLAGRNHNTRRVPPAERNGPPWWDIAFTPLKNSEEILGVVGFITVTGDTATPAAARKVPAIIGTLRDQHAMAFSFDRYAGLSPATNRFLSQLRHAAEATAPLWLSGERGSGKETAARVVHHSGARRNAAFITLDCAGIQPYLIESLLFGRGAFLEGGHAGTVYLKEPAALPRDVQQRFADLFTTNDPGTHRLICGSLLPAGQQVADRKLVPDFHTQLSVLELVVPPLRDRLADLARFATQRHPSVSFDPATFDALATQSWPGNLRELHDVLNDAVTTARGSRVKPEHLPQSHRPRLSLATAPVPMPSLKLDAILQSVEKRVIALALARTRGNATKAAELLGIYRTRLLRQMKSLGISRPGEAES